MATTEQLRWKKYPVLNDGFICLVDAMGDDSSIVQAARVSYGKDERGVKDVEIDTVSKHFGNKISDIKVDYIKGYHVFEFESDLVQNIVLDHREDNDLLMMLKDLVQKAVDDFNNKDRALIRYLLAHGHTTPFEMVEIKFLVRVPMDCWRQWIRHRTASVNEYSTRYTEAIDSQQTTSPQEWRLQATDNKQGSSGYLEDLKLHGAYSGEIATQMERKLHKLSRDVYLERIDNGIAKEQARKDLPLSTYTEAYWKCDLHNIFNFLRLRMDSHAQLEIRSYANAMYAIVKQICPVACEAFEDYVLNAKKFSRMEMEYLRTFLSEGLLDIIKEPDNKPTSMTDREWKEFLGKLS